MDHDSDEDLEAFDLEPMVRSQLAWDLLPHDEMRKWMPLIGVTPPSAESFDMAHREAHERGKAAQPLLALAEVYSAIIAEIQTVYFGHEGACDEEDLEEFTESAYQLIRSAILAVLVEFLNEGIIQFGEVKVVHVREDSDEEEGEQ